MKKRDIKCGIGIECGIGIDILAGMIESLCSWSCNVMYLYVAVARPADWPDQPGRPDRPDQNFCKMYFCIVFFYFYLNLYLYLYLYFLFEEGSDVSLCCDPCGLVLPPSLHGPSLFSWLDGPVRRGLPPLNLSKNKYLVFGFGIYIWYLVFGVSIWYLSQRFTWIILE